MKRTRAVLCLLIVGIVFVLVPGISLAAAIRTLPNLTSVDFYEATSGSHQNNFLPNSLEMINRLPDPLGPPAVTNGPDNWDFRGTQLEFYDVFYSDANGALNINGAYITVEVRYPFALPSSGGLNIEEVYLNFSNGAIEHASIVSSFVGMGDNFDPNSVPNAIDGNIATATQMGNTGQSETDRLRITIGFPDSVPVPEASTLILLGAGLVGLFICNRKRVNFA
jgi:hypothetical protein